MKKITGILGDHGASGVYLLKGESPVAELEELATQRGYRFFHLKGEDVKNKTQFLAVAAETFKFPEYFGHNWDSFEECINDMSWHDAKGFVILFEQFEQLADSSPGDFETALGIFRDAAQTWKDEGKAWYMVLRGNPRTKLEITSVQI